MKKYLTIILLGLLSMQSMAQLTIQSGTRWVTSGQVTVNIQDMNFANNGSFVPGLGVLRFSGTQSNSIGGTSTIPVYHLDLQKTNTAQVTLQTNIQVSSMINFGAGYLNLNNKTVTLNNGALLNNEKETSRIIATTGGEVIYTATLNAPNAVNPGNLGAVISSTANLGTVTIKRGHLLQSGSGLSNSINRYYIITPQNNTGLNASIRFIYFDGEKNGLDENSFVLYQSADGTSWTNLSQTARSTSLNYVEKTVINSFSKYTLGTDVVAPGCSATNVALSVKAAKQNTVSITWATATETNNKAFAVDRKLKGETLFSQIGYVASKAIAGNSSTQLSYSFTDSNAPADTAYYRLRIISLTDNICFSDSKTFVPKGGGKGKPNNNVSLVDAKQGELFATEPKLTVGPNPNNGNFFFSIDGIEDPTVVELFTIDGKAVSKFIVTNLQKQQVTGLRSGVYLLRVPVKGLAQKIIVQ